MPENQEADACAEVGVCRLDITSVLFRELIISNILRRFFRNVLSTDSLHAKEAK